MAWERVGHAYLAVPYCKNHLRGQHQGKMNLCWIVVLNHHGREGVGDRPHHVMVTRKHRERMGVDLGGGVCCGGTGRREGGKRQSRCIV